MLLAAFMAVRAQDTEQNVVVVDETAVSEVVNTDPALFIPAGDAAVTSVEVVEKHRGGRKPRRVTGCGTPDRFNCNICDLPSSSSSTSSSSSSTSDSVAHCRRRHHRHRRNRRAQGHIFYGHKGRHLGRHVQRTVERLKHKGYNFVDLKTCTKARVYRKVTFNHAEDAILAL